MIQTVLHIEDCLEMLCRLKGDGNFHINENDRALLDSFARQVFRNTALTDRQYALAKEKLASYREQFVYNSVEGFDEAVSQLRLPLRHIDRSKTVTLVDGIETKSGPVDGTWIKIRFPFNKKTIVAVEAVAKSLEKNYYHELGTLEHYFLFDEVSTYEIVEEFKDRNFDIDQEILDYYKRVAEVKSNPEDYLPLYKNNELFNISDSLRQKIGQDTDYDAVKIIDRKRRYGLITDDQVSGEDLLATLVNRKDLEVFVNNENVALQDVLSTIWKLDRFPLLIGLNNNNAEDSLYKCYSILRNLVATEEQSVLFRLDGPADFNEYVKDKKLNNWVNKDTKVVYINSNKLPKILLQQDCDWKPITSLFFNSSSIDRYVDLYANERTDLQIMYDNQMSPLRKHSQIYRW